MVVIHAGGLRQAGVEGVQEGTVIRKKKVTAWSNLIRQIRMMGSVAQLPDLQVLDCGRGISIEEDQQALTGQKFIRHTHIVN